MDKDELMKQLIRIDRDEAELHGLPTIKGPHNRRVVMRLETRSHKRRAVLRL